MFQLHPGDCFNHEFPEGATEELATLPMVDCDAPHDNEAYASFDMPGGAFPSDLAFDDEAVVRCEPLFEDYVGSSYETSRLDFGWLFPTVESWADGDRRVDCVLFDYNLNKLTGSMKNSGE